jgi:hypothetical protein
MNIFALHDDPYAAAQMQCDKHVVKMPLECAQMLCTVQRAEGNDDPALYRSTHVKHPCTVWAGANTANYFWLFEHFQALAQEYFYRYGRQHLSWVKLKNVLKSVPQSITIANDHTPFALAMPDQYKFFDSPVECYRAYYKHEKAPILKYTKRAMPVWLA